MQSLFLRSALLGAKQYGAGVRNTQAQSASNRLFSAGLSRSTSFIHHDPVASYADREPGRRGSASEPSSEDKPMEKSPRKNDGSDKDSRMMTVIVTGAAGNLGHKVANHLLQNKSGNNKYHLVLMDSAPCPPELDLENNPAGHEVEYVQCDFSKYDDEWVSKFQDCDAALLFAARNPLPDASSLDAYISMMINAHSLEACAKGKTKRVIFASSNHVVGGMLHENSKIPPNAPPKFGTKYKIKDFSMDSTLYASAKVAGETEIQSMIASGRLNEAIILRIGFCQPGDNPKSTLPLTGNPKKEIKDDKSPKSDEEKRVSDWWKGMYLKNEDLESLIDKCLQAKLKGQQKLAYVNGVSKNPESRWLVQDNPVGYQPSSV